MATSSFSMLKPKFGIKLFLASSLIPHPLFPQIPSPLPSKLYRRPKSISPFPLLPPIQAIMSSSPDDCNALWMDLPGFPVFLNLATRVVLLKPIPDHFMPLLKIWLIVPISFRMKPRGLTMAYWPYMISFIHYSTLASSAATFLLTHSTPNTLIPCLSSWHIFLNWSIIYILYNV